MMLLNRQENLKLLLLTLNGLHFLVYLGGWYMEYLIMNNILMPFALLVHLVLKKK